VHLRYKSYWYEIADNEIIIEKGVWYRKLVHIPYERIQNIEITRTPILSMLGLSTVAIQTAGESYYWSHWSRYYRRTEGLIEGVVNGEELCERIRNRSGIHRSQGV
jgi:uncharacterized membrane protein YdbT with pleckstrin-like domain